MSKFSCQCGRCGGSGKYDRGSCFDCNGLGFKNVARKPTLLAHVLTVTYSNGSVNTVTIYASLRAVAVEIVSRQLKIKGWIGEVK
jgi:DnaJ-class molecular chaperone